jgi:DNA mismatch repair protein MutL
VSRRIQVLPDTVANQIAAGEVVERPASVVKELVENALDAGASRVEIGVDRGGKRRIRVSDDGRGMSREDALLSLDRHATSKIRSADDLRGVGTFGFRGEALPSIAAVSRLTLETREEGEEVGTSLRVKGGRITVVEDAPRRPGTTVEVENLFFNAPARSSFLKSTRAETRAVSDTVTALALASPAVAFVLRSGDRTLLDLPAAAEPGVRVGDLWGREAATSLLPVAGRAEGIRLRGLIQRPDAARPGLRRAYLFVNGRPFRSPGVVRAADRGYRTTVPAGSRPWLFLYLEVDGEAVDVNVHPAKAEVRFREEGRVEERVEEWVRDALGGEASAATFGPGSSPAALEVRDRPAPGERDRRPPGGAEEDSQMALFLPGGATPATDPELGDEGLAPSRDAILAGRPRLWQALDTYVLAETREGLLIIDQHSAHERILFERLMRAFEGEGQEAQRLLFPLTIRLSPQEVEQVEALAGILARAGFEVDGFGGDTVLVQAVPDPHPWFDAERCFREMVEELTHGSELVRSARNQHERIAMTFACKGAIKAGQRMDEREMHELFDALFATELPHHDVHGRPTIVRLSATELERKFGRHG